MWGLVLSGRGHVSEILDMVGQENNSTQFGFLYMVGQGLSREKAFVPGPGTMMIFIPKLLLRCGLFDWTLFRLILKKAKALSGL